MLNKFHYKNFEPNFENYLCAERALERLEEIAPYSSTIIGVVEKAEANYIVTVDIYSKHGTFLATAQDPILERALVAVEEKIKNKLDCWKRARFETLQNGALIPARDENGRMAVA